MVAWDLNPRPQDGRRRRCNPSYTDQIVSLHKIQKICYVNPKKIFYSRCMLHNPNGRPVRSTYIKKNKIEIQGNSNCLPSHVNNKLKVTDSTVTNFFGFQLTRPDMEIILGKPFHPSQTFFLTRRDTLSRPIYYLVQLMQLLHGQKCPLVVDSSKSNLSKNVSNNVLNNELKDVWRSNGLWQETLD